MQPAAFLPGEHKIIMVGPEQVRRRGNVVIRRDRRMEYTSGSRIRNPDTSPLAGFDVRRPDRPRPSAALREVFGGSFLSTQRTAVVDLDGDRKSTRLNSSHTVISYAVFCLKKKKQPHLSLVQWVP